MDTTVLVIILTVVIMVIWYVVSNVIGNATQAVWDTAENALGRRADRKRAEAGEDVELLLDRFRDTPAMPAEAEDAAARIPVKLYAKMSHMGELERQQAASKLRAQLAAGGRVGKGIVEWEAAAGEPGQLPAT